MSEHAPSDASTLFPYDRTLSPEGVHKPRELPGEAAFRQEVNDGARQIIHLVEANLFGKTTQSETAEVTEESVGEIDFSGTPEGELVSMLATDDKRLRLAEARAALGQLYPAPPVPTQAEIIESIKEASSDQFALAA